MLENLLPKVFAVAGDKAPSGKVPLSFARSAEGAHYVVKLSGRMAWCPEGLPNLRGAVSGHCERPGANPFGGRWNSPEHRVVYASGNLTLAMLEVLATIDDAEVLANKAYAYHSIAFDEEAVAVLPESLPEHWNARPETLASQSVGEEFLNRAEGVVLAV